MDNLTEHNNNNNNNNNNNMNEYSFRWGKQFTFLTLKTLDTKIVITHTSIKIEKKVFYLGFIKGKTMNYEIPISMISHIETKSILSLPDLSVAVIYALLGLLNPLFYLIVLLSIWACINTNLIIHTKSNKQIKIPSFSKKDANDFIHYINDIFIED